MPVYNAKPIAELNKREVITFLVAGNLFSSHHYRIRRRLFRLEPSGFATRNHPDCLQPFLHQLRLCGNRGVRASKAEGVSTFRI
jgi:hypothetical protein